VDLFASSGGAVNALALVARHPEQVRTLVAHEPPAAQLVPDREQALAAVVDIRRTYERGGVGPAMAKFIALTSLRGEVPADFADRPVNPAEFGLPTEDDGSRDDPLLGQNIMTSTHYQPDFDALRAASTRIVVGVGAESEGELAHRAGRPWPNGSARRPSPSPATTAVSSAANSAGVAIRTPSPSRCARSSPTRQGGGPRRAAWRCG
jgi:pimeloyl-ACP methyl ester carboxylesterase